MMTNNIKEFDVKNGQVIERVSEETARERLGGRAYAGSSYEFRENVLTNIVK